MGVTAYFLFESQILSVRPKWYWRYEVGEIRPASHYDEMIFLGVFPAEDQYTPRLRGLIAAWRLWLAIPRKVR